MFADDETARQAAVAEYKALRRAERQEIYRSVDAYDYASFLRNINAIREKAAADLERCETTNRVGLERLESIQQDAVRLCEATKAKCLKSGLEMLESLNEVRREYLQAMDRLDDLVSSARLAPDEE